MVLRDLQEEYSLNFPISIFANLKVNLQHNVDNKSSEYGNED